MLSGVITKLVGSKGFGFISPRPDPGKRDYFFHANELLGVRFEELCCGDVVGFELVATELGPRAHGLHRWFGPPELTTRHELAAAAQPVAVRALQECSTELVEYLTKHPEALRDLHPGAFENLVAAIFRHEGFDTERISSWNEPDGGVDLIAVRHVSGFKVRLAIQCKRWSQTRKLSAEPLRSLAGVLDRFQAHAGVVATTGLFSEDAEKEKTSYLWRISLRDYNDILASLIRLSLTQ